MIAFRTQAELILAVRLLVENCLSLGKIQNGNNNESLHLGIIYSPSRVFWTCFPHLSLADPCTGVTLTWLIFIWPDPYCSDKVSSWLNDRKYPSVLTSSFHCLFCAFVYLFSSTRLCFPKVGTFYDCLTESP